MELMVGIATADPGDDGLYRAARARRDPPLPARRAAHGTLLMLDIQPGRARFLPEVTRLERWLASRTSASPSTRSGASGPARSRAR